MKRPTAKPSKAKAKAKDAYVARVLAAMETTSDEMSLADYADALSDIYAEVDSRIDAANDDIERKAVSQ